MDIIKHIIHEERIRKQMYDNHECTALELEGRSFNEKILKLADRIEELEAQVSKANKRADKAAADGWLKTAETQLARALKAEAQVERVREVRNWLSTQCTNSHAVKALDKALKEERS